MLGNADFSKSLIEKSGLAHELKEKKKRKKRKKERKKTVALEYWHSATCSIPDK